MKAKQDVKVSVSLITYNHAPFIAQAIEGALMQRTNFPFEIVIGEDGSNDGTREIVTQFQARHPDQIRLLLHERGIRSQANGKPTGNWNLATNIGNCRGEYIALLDGDDYWTSPLKLQEQADLLDSDRTLALCYHNVRISDESDPSRDQLHENKQGKKTLKNLLRGNFMQTCSVMFRKGLFSDFPRWFYEAALGDWPLHVLNAQHGDIGYIHEVMGVYRKHANAAWSQHNRIEADAGTIQTAELIRGALAPRDRRYLDRSIARWHRKLIECCLSLGDRNMATRFAAEYFKKFPPYKSWFGFRLKMRLGFRRAFQPGMPG